MLSPAAISIPNDAVRRERAQMRLYVLCQVVGWGLFLAMQLFFAIAFNPRDTPQDPIKITAMMAMIAAHGLLLTHYSRPFIARWGWRELGWRTLFPRVLATALLLSALWSAIGYGYNYGVLREHWESKYSMPAIFTISWLNGGLVLGGWYCFYFIYHLFDRFNRSEIERLRLMTAVKDSELRALKSQVNPHFIFNSLNSLRALIEEDPARARLAVTQLANLLRYSLQSSQLETVPFEDELRVVNDYLALEQVRHEERLRLRMDIAPETLQLPVPPMLLQTLVENAVKYGISQRPEGGEIAIIARSESGYLRIQVTNPGELPPISATVPQALTARRAASTGLGLRNAAERLRLLFGERATLQLRADSPSVVVAEALIPLRLAAA
ncbi:MAG: histidine kinase [Undibacterium sp.]|nr:histidine kinase [Opitutaceae bacterium]